MEQSKNEHSLKNAKRLALVLPKILTDQSVGAALALFLFFKGQQNEITIFSDTPMPASWGCLDIRLLSEQSAGGGECTVIAIDTKKTPIREVRYENIPGTDSLEIILVPEQRAIAKEDIAIEKKIMPPDSVITIAAKNISSIGSIWKRHPEIFYEKPVIAVDSSDTGETLAEKTVEILKTISAKPYTPEIALALLYALFAETQCLNGPNTSKQTIALGSELMREGADHARVLASFTTCIPLPHLQLLGRACARSKADQDRSVFWSFITADDFALTKTTSDIMPSVMKTMRDLFPMPKIAVFLWQEAASKNIRTEITVAGKKNYSLPDIRTEYPSFREAEEHITQLLTKIA